jgi:hypothetical protein
MIIVHMRGLSGRFNEALEQEVDEGSDFAADVPARGVQRPNLQFAAPHGAPWVEPALLTPVKNGAGWPSLTTREPGRTDAKIAGDDSTTRGAATRGLSNRMPSRSVAAGAAPPGTGTDSRRG